MRINKDKLLELAALPDEALWREIVSVGRAHGFSLPERTPPHEELEKLRDTVRGAKINVGDAIRLLNNCRAGGEK